MPRATATPSSSSVLECQLEVDSALGRPAVIEAVAVAVASYALSGITS